MIIGAGLLGSCSFFLNPAEPNIKDEIYMEYETMMDAFVEIDSIQDVSDYLLFWAQTLGVQAQKDRFQNVIVETSGIASMEATDLITIECGISLDNLAQDLRAVAISMVLIKEIQDTQQIRLLFAPYDESSYFGAKNISSYYFKNTEMIHLNTIDPNNVIIQGASANMAYIERAIKTKKPSYKMAYQITIDGFNQEFPGEEFSEDKFSMVPNGIKELGALFAYCKSRGMLFEIADYSGGSSSDFAPISGTAIMVINQNDIKSLESSYDKMETRLKKAYENIYPELLVTMTAIQAPALVLSNEDTDHLVSFVYTLFNGFCGVNEYSFSSLNQVAITKNKFTGSLLLLNLIGTEMMEEDDALNVICNLNSMNHRLKELHRGWYQDANSQFVVDFLKIADKNPKTTFLESSLVEYQLRNNEMPKLSYGVDLKDCERQLTVLKEYIESRSLI